MYALIRYLFRCRLEIKIAHNYHLLIHLVPFAVAILEVIKTRTKPFCEGVLITPKVTRKQEGNFPKGNPESRKIQNGQYASSQQRQIENLRDCMARLHTVGTVHRRAQTTNDITIHGSNINKNPDVKSRQLINC